MINGFRMYNYVLCFASCLSLHTVNGRCMHARVLYILCMVTKSNLAQINRGIASQQSTACA